MVLSQSPVPSQTCPLAMPWDRPLLTTWDFPKNIPSLGSKCGRFSSCSTNPLLLLLFGATYESTEGRFSSLPPQWGGLLPWDPFSSSSIYPPQGYYIHFHGLTMQGRSVQFSSQPWLLFSSKCQNDFLRELLNMWAKHKLSCKEFMLVVWLAIFSLLPLPAPMLPNLMA